MSDLRELYQELIIDHGRHPRNFGSLPNSTCCKQGYNPLCGDKLTLYINLEDGQIKEMCFEGSGCAISTASASLMTECLKEKNIEEADEIFQLFHHLVTEGGLSDIEIEKLGKLSALAGVAEFPARVKCATLAWHTFKAAIQAGKEVIDVVSTE